MMASRSGRNWTANVLVTIVLAVAAFRIGAQDKPKREMIRAQAMGQNRAAGKSFNRGGQAARSKSWSKMQPKGRVAVTGTLGYSIAYFRMFPAENGRKIRLITDRPIRFLEARENGRSTDYDLSTLELNLDNDKSKSSESLIIRTASEGG